MQTGNNMLSSINSVAREARASGSRRWNYGPGSMSRVSIGEETRLPFASFLSAALR